jgi:VanZ family protein
MLPLRHANCWQVASLFILFVVLAAALMPAFWFWDDKSKALSWFRNIDKALHVATFLVLAVWFSGLYRKNSYWKIAVGLLAFGLMIEVCQRAVGYRSAEWTDVFADATGIVLGLMIALTGIGGWCLRAEEIFSKRRS